MRKKLGILLCILLFLPTLVSAEGEGAESFSVADIFTDNMVLQADREIVIWGNGAPEGSTLSVCLDNEKTTAVIENGAWEAHFPARPAGGEPFVIRIIGSAEAEHIDLENIVMGDVWLVLGQSNIEYNAANLAEWDSLAARLPGNARLISYTSRDITDNADDCAGRARTWRMMTEISAQQASAIGVLLTAEIAPMTGFEPVGLISAGFRGQDLAMFLPADIAKDMDATDKKSVIYDKVLSGFSRFPIRGMVWYQGEANGVLYKDYASHFSAFLERMRRDRGDFPVYITELAPCFPSGGQYLDFGTVRGVIDTLPLYAPDVTVCPTSDLWADRTFSNNLHPNNKPAVASRLAMAIGAHTYGLWDWSAPTVSGARYGETKKEVYVTYSEPIFSNGELRGFAGVGKKWDKISLHAEKTAENEIRLSADSDIYMIRYNCEASDVFGETLSVQSANGIPAAGLCITLTEPDKPSFVSRALLYIIGYGLRYWYAAAGLIIFAAAMIIWRIKRKRKG